MSDWFFELFLLLLLEPLYIDDLENILDETMAESFNTEIEDGSVEEVHIFICFAFILRYELKLKHQFMPNFKKKNLN